jgi:hypothetical protein
MTEITWPYFSPCIVYNCKNNCGALLNVPSAYQSSHSLKKLIFLVVEKIKILLFVAPLSYCRNKSPDEVCRYSSGIVSSSNVLGLGGTALLRFLVL